MSDWTQSPNFEEAFAPDTASAILYFDTPRKSVSVREQFRQQTLPDVRALRWAWGGSGLTRTLPAHHPILDWMRAVAVSFQDNDVGGCRAKVLYQPLDFDVRPDGELSALPGSTPELNRWVVRQQRYGGKSLPIPRNTIRFIEPPYTGLAVPEIGLATLVPFAELTYSWIDVPFYPAAAVDQCVGRVNAEPFDGAAGHPLHPPETLFCLQPAVRWSVNAHGRKVCRIDYTFLHNASGWNTSPTGTGEYSPIRWASTRGHLAGQLAGTFSGSLKGTLSGTFDGVEGTHDLDGPGSVAVTGSLQGVDDGDTVRGDYFGSVTGTYTDGRGDHVIHGTLTGAINGRIPRDWEKVFKCAPFDTLFQVPAQDFS